MPKHFYSDNDTGTPADALKAIGLAEVLQAWLEALQRPDRTVAIQDCGSYYQLTLPTAIEPADIAQVAHSFPAGRGRPLVKKSKGQQAEGFDYEAEQARRTLYFELRKKLAPADLKRFQSHPEAEEFAHIPTPHPDLSLYACVNIFLKGNDAYNNLCEQWLGDSCWSYFQPTPIRLILPARAGMRF
jgi:hypothetical protein